MSTSKTNTPSPATTDRLETVLRRQKKNIAVDAVLAAIFVGGMTIAALSFGVSLDKLSPNSAPIASEVIDAEVLPVSETQPRIALK